MTRDESIALIRSALLATAPDRAADFDDISSDSEIAVLGIDSIGLLDVSAHIEDSLNATFPDDQLAQVVKVGDLMKLIVEHTPTSSSLARPDQ